MVAAEGLELRRRRKRRQDNMEEKTGQYGGEDRAIWRRRQGNMEEKTGQYGGRKEKEEKTVRQDKFFWKPKSALFSNKASSDNEYH